MTLYLLFKKEVTELRAQVTTITKRIDMQDSCTVITAKEKFWSTSKSLKVNLVV